MGAGALAGDEVAVREADKQAALPISRIGEGDGAIVRHIGMADDGAGMGRWRWCRRRLRRLWCRLLRWLLCRPGSWRRLRSFGRRFGGRGGLLWAVSGCRGGRVARRGGGCAGGRIRHGRCSRRRLRVLETLCEVGKADAAYSENPGYRATGGDQFDHAAPLLQTWLLARSLFGQAHRGMLCEGAGHG